MESFIILKFSWTFTNQHFRAIWEQKPDQHASLTCCIRLKVFHFQKTCETKMRKNDLFTWSYWYLKRVWTKNGSVFRLASKNHFSWLVGTQWELKLNKTISWNNSKTSSNLL